MPGDLAISLQGQVGSQETSIYGDELRLGSHLERDLKHTALQV